MAPLLAPVLEAIVVPALQTDNEEMQEMGLATAAVLAGLAGVAFVPYYQQFFDGVREVLTPVRALHNRRVLPVGFQSALSMSVCSGCASAINGRSTFRAACAAMRCGRHFGCAVVYICSS